MAENNYFMQRLAERREERAAAPACGHAPTYFKSGVNDAYWNASCSCGWQSKSWTHYKRDVVAEYKAHLFTVEQGS